MCSRPFAVVFLAGILAHASFARSEDAAATQERVDELTAAIEANAADAGLRYKRGAAYYKRGQLDAAIVDFDAALAIDPESTSAILGRAYCQLRKREYRKAESDFNAVLKRDPSVTDAFAFRAVARREQGDVEGAIADLGSALALEPERATAHADRGLLHMRRLDYRAAIADFDAAIRLSPPSAALYDHRGHAHLANKDEEAALADFNEALRLDPQNPSARFGLAWVMATSGDTAVRNGSRALEEATAVCEHFNWTDAGALDALAAAHAEVGDFGKAIEHAEKAAELFTKESDKKAVNGRLDLYRAKKPYRTPPADAP